MSLGQGRIERVVEAAFTEYPDRAILTCYLVSKAYPGEYITKSHRVATLRAADKVASRMGWSKHRKAAQGGECMYIRYS
jgi:hypothetical protein